MPLPPPRRHLFVRPGYPEAAIRSIRALSHPCYPYLHQSLADRLETDKPGVYRCRVFSSAPPIQALTIVRSTPGYPPGGVALLRCFVNNLAVLYADAMLDLDGVVGEIFVAVANRAARKFATAFDS